MTFSTILPSGTVAIVTGAASGIGRASAAALERAGALVALLDLAPERPAGLDGALYVPCDVTDESNVRAAVGRIRTELGPISVVHNNAGICLNGDGPGMDGAAHDLELDVWERTFAVNITGCFLVAKHTLPDMLAGGSGAIINTASVGGTMIGAPQLAYASSKAAVGGFTRALAVQYGPRGIRSNAICPGPIRTPMSTMARAEGEELAEWLHRIALRRIGEPQDVGEVVAFLASSSAAFNNGAMIAVDGGMTVH